MEDLETRTWWQQVTGEAILGPLKGRRLEPMAWDEVSFAVWKREHPYGEVLLADSKFQAKYVPADWETRILKRPTVTPADPKDSLKPRDLIVGIEIGGLSKAFPLEALRKQNPIVDTLGPVPLLLVVDADSQSVRGFDRRVEGQTLELFLKPNSKPILLVDGQSGSEWDFSGKAISGPMTGKRLKRIQVLKDFWFDWRLYHPKTRVFALPH